MLLTKGLLLTRTRFALAFLLLASACTPGPVMGAEAPESLYRFYTWKAEQGLPQNSVKVIHQTRDGYLWFGTRFGIVRFDAVSFRVFNRVNTEALPYDSCLAIAEEKNGLLWFATPHGAVSYWQGRFTSHGLCEGKQEGRGYSICV